jgi:hypothetical protein
MVQSARLESGSPRADRPPRPASVSPKPPNQCNSASGRPPLLGWPLAAVGESQNLLDLAIAAEHYDPVLRGKPQGVTGSRVKAPAAVCSIPDENRFPQRLLVLEAALTERPGHESANGLRLLRVGHCRLDVIAAWIQRRWKKGCQRIACLSLQHRLREPEGASAGQLSLQRPRFARVD